MMPFGLEGMIEFDEGYFEKATKHSDKENLKRGRGSQRQSNVAVMAESIKLENLKSRKQENHVRYFKMKVLETHKKEEINQAISKNISEQSIVFSDKNTSYVNISDYVEIHVTEKSDKTTTKEILKWVHIAISNAKRTFLGIYHKIDGKYLQKYLNKFVCKLNRRCFGIN